MRNFNKFIKEIKRLNIKSNEYRYLNGAGWVSVKKHKNLPNNLKKRFVWELRPLKESKLKELQSYALNELYGLSYEQLNNYSVRIEELNAFKSFFEFLKRFYVKVDNNNYNGLDVADFRYKLESCFFVDLPKSNDFDINFLTELTDQITFNSGLLNEVILAINSIVIKNKPQQKTIAEIFKDEKENRIINAIWLTKTKLRFNSLNPDFSNIDEVYKNNLLLWYIDNSDSVKAKNGNAISRTNEKILNPENIEVSKTKQGFKLTEIDFINAELERFEFLEVTKLNLVEKKQYQYYKEFLLRKREEQKQAKSATDEKCKTQNLFKVGLLFAKGEMNKYFTINSHNKTIMNKEYSAPKIANELGDDSYNKWILATINNYSPSNSNGNKNIFNSLTMMRKIIKHCEDNKIPVDPYFISRLPIE